MKPPINTVELSRNQKISPRRHEEILCDSSCLRGGQGYLRSQENSDEILSRRPSICQL